MALKITGVDVKIIIMFEMNQNNKVIHIFQSPLKDASQDLIKDSSY